MAKKICEDHPNITKENYIEYIDDFYEAHYIELEEIRKDTEACFLDIKDVLF